MRFFCALFRGRGNFCGAGGWKQDSLAARPCREAFGASSDERVPCSAQAEQAAFTMLCSLPLSMRAHIRRCRRSHVSPFRRGSPGNVPFWHVMPWSLHFIFRGGPEKKRSKEKGPNVDAAFLRDNTSCGTRPGVRSLDGASCAVTGIFLMAGVIKPLTLRAANTVRRHKNRKGGSHRPPGPDAGPAHFDS